MTARKALCSIGAGPHAALLALSEPTFRAYAERHGYELVTSTERDPRRPPAWAKVPRLRELLETFELVLWIDADAVIVDDRKDIADELQPERQLAVVQHSYQNQLVPNTGVMLLRAGPFARALLDRMWDATSLIDHPWWDNAAFVDALGYRLPGSLQPGLRGRLHRLLRRRLERDLRPCVPVRDSPFLVGTQFLGNEWNSIYRDRAEHPRIVHCPGAPIRQRIDDLTTELEAARARSGGQSAD
jgi:hypothetical protein